VSDTGRGFTPEELSRLYQPFTRFGREGDTTEGAGIGLVITRRLVELMHGQLDVESVAGSGSVFSVTLPACDAPARLAPAGPAASSSAPAIPAAGTRHRLLYVEDNPSNVSLLREVLRLRPGCELQVATDGLTGLALARAERFDLAIIDIDLPGLDGVELCLQLRNDPATRSLPLLALSANAMPADIGRALRAGFDRYLTKPFDVTSMLGEMDRLLARGDVRPLES
jgi:CheY-like chemotaxis protein